MSLTFFDVMYLVVQVLGTYALFNFVRAFFDEPAISLKFRIAAGVLYYVTISFLFIFFSIPVLTLAANIIAIFLICCCYVSSMRKKILVTFIVYLAMFCCELSVVALTNYIHFPLAEKNNYSDIFGLILINILYFALSALANAFVNIRRGDRIPISYWISLLVVPVSLLVLLMTVFGSTDISQPELVLDVVLVMLINFTVFCLYDRVSRYVSEEAQRALILRQNAYYEKQLELMESSLNATRTLRHDMKNHLTSIYSSLESDDVSAARKHIEQVTDVFRTSESCNDTGNPAVDSVISFKEQEASHMGATLKKTIAVPSGMEFSSFDAAVILGNLLDNSLRAVSTLEDAERCVEVDMRYSKGLLHITVRNPYKGELRPYGRTYLSTKPDSDSHGLGLDSVRRAAAKYNGTIDISSEDNLFEVTVLLYLNDASEPAEQAAEAGRA